MIITKNYDGGQVQVYVSGAINPGQDVYEILDELKVTALKPLHLTFIDALMVPYDLIEAILRVQLNPKSKSLFMYVCKANLHNYLLSLGLENVNCRKTPHAALADPRAGLILSLSGDLQASEGGEAGKITNLLRALPSTFPPIFILTRSDSEQEFLLSCNRPGRIRLRLAQSGDIPAVTTVHVINTASRLCFASGRLVRDHTLYVTHNDYLSAFMQSFYDNYAGVVAVVCFSESVDVVKLSEAIVSHMDVSKMVALAELTTGPQESGFWDLLKPSGAIKHFALPCLIRYFTILMKNTRARASVSTFLKAVYDCYQVDFRHYRHDSIKRRLISLCGEEGYESLKNIELRALEDPAVFEHIIFWFSITMTEFFRDPDTYLFLRKNVFSELTSLEVINVWCAGASRGKEPYSMAIALKEAQLLKKVRLIATDINPHVLLEAQNAVYPSDTIPDESDNYLAAGSTGCLSDYFVRTHGYVRVTDDVRQSVLFMTHDITTEPPPGRFHIIFCRYVLMYFKKAMQLSTLKVLENSLESGGFLVVGEKETIDIDPAKFALKTVSRGVYRKCPPTC